MASLIVNPESFSLKANILFYWPDYQPPASLWLCGIDELLLSLGLLHVQILRVSNFAQVIANNVRTKHFSMVCLTALQMVLAVTVSRNRLGVAVWGT